MKRIILYILILVTCAWLYSIENANKINYADLFPVAAISTIQTGLVDFVSCIPKDRITDYGFMTDAELKNTHLGTPFRLYSIKPELIISYKRNTSIDQILEKTSQWYFPIYVDQEIRAMLLVEETSDGQFHPVSFGYVPLAGDLNRALADDKWNIKNNPKLVVVYQAKEFFLAKPTAEPQKLFPLQYVTETGLMPNDDLLFNIDRIRPKVETNLKGGL